MILLLLIISCTAVSSTRIDLIAFLEQTLEQFQNETLALVNVNDELAKKMSGYVCYKVNFPLSSIELDHGRVRECSLVLIGASHVNYEVSNIACINGKSKFLIMYTPYDGSIEAIHRTERILRSFGIFKTFHVIPDPLTIVAFDISGNIRAEMSPHGAIPMILKDHIENPSGYCYKVHYTTLQPYASAYDNEGIDISIVKVVVKYQNATVAFFKDLGNVKKMRSILKNYGKNSIDFSIARTVLTENVSKDRVYLPQWEQLCVTVPRRHERPLLIQLVKPFSFDLWIFLVVYSGVRFTRIWQLLIKYRLILLMFLIVDFCLMESYIAKVMCYLIDMRYFAVPKTMEELNDRGESFAVTSSEKPILDSYQGLKIVEVKQKEIWQYLHYSTIAYCKIAECFDHTKTNYDPDTNDKLVTILNERLMLYPAFYSFAGGHPLRGRFQLVLERMFDAGIWAKIYNKWTSDWKQFESFLSGVKDVISFSDMHSLWILLAGGYLVSIGCFLVEMIRNR